MINSNVFDYINVMGKTADASWKRNEILSHLMTSEPSGSGTDTWTISR